MRKCIKLIFEETKTGKCKELHVNSSLYSLADTLPVSQNTLQATCGRNRIIVSLIAGPKIYCKKLGSVAQCIYDTFFFLQNYIWNWMKNTCLNNFYCFIFF